MFHPTAALPQGYILDRTLLDPPPHVLNPAPHLWVNRDKSPRTSRLSGRLQGHAGRRRRRRRRTHGKRRHQPPLCVNPPSSSQLLSRLRRPPLSSIPVPLLTPSSCLHAAPHQRFGKRASFRCSVSFAEPSDQKDVLQIYFRFLDYVTLHNLMCYEARTVEDDEQV